MITYLLPYDLEARKRWLYNKETACPKTKKTESRSQWLAQF